MLVSLANKYTLLITPTQVRLIHGVELFQTSHYISKIDFYGQDVDSLEQAIRQSLEKVKDLRAKVYVRVSYPFIKTDVLSATNAYLNHQENRRRAKHLFDTSYGETVLDSTVRVNEVQFDQPSLAECIDNKVLYLVTSLLNQGRFKLIEITSVHTWIINSFSENRLTGGLLFCQDDIYTYSLITNNNVTYVAQFRSQIGHLAEAFLHQIRKSLLIRSWSIKTLKVHFLTDAENHELINFSFDTLKVPEYSMEIHQRIGML